MVGLASGCGADRGPQTNPNQSLIPLTIGRGAAFRPKPYGRTAAGGAAIDGLRCAARRSQRTGAHLELFASRHVVLIPAGVGVAPPQRQSRSRVLAGRCWYPVATVDPSGVIEIDAQKRISLGAFFEVWGQPLSRKRMVTFRSRVLAFVDGRRWRGDPRRIPLERHREIVLEVGGYVVPHRVYRYPPGL